LTQHTHYYLVIEAKTGAKEMIKASPVKNTAITLAERYHLKNRGHHVSVAAERLCAKTGRLVSEEIWTSKRLGGRSR